MSLDAVKAAIVAQLTDDYRQTKKVRMVESHRGRFDSVAEIKRHGTASPALLVCTDGVRNCQERFGRHGGIWGDASFFVYIVTRDLPGVTRDTQAEALAGQLAHTVIDNTWNDKAQSVKSIDARNLTTTEVDKLGVALWAVGWQQPVLIEPVDADSGLDTFATLSATWDSAPGDGEPTMEATIELEQETRP
ncbi:hypothetical protein GCM10023116_39670 [Kistimonas scapharcae]|uniref:Uncharacterized protein n=1 Tax=Kistimonas scapharcae TaxID=1036133 RepID=A0ABP8V844_9GAMM